MVSLKLIRFLAVVNAAFVVAGAPLLEPINLDPAESENVAVIRDARGAEPLRKGHLHHLIHHHHHHYNHGSYEEPTHHKEGGGPVATFAQSSAGTISGNHGHGGSASQSSSQSASYSFGPFSASFSASHSNANAGGGFFDY